MAEYGVDPSEVFKGNIFNETIRASGFVNFESLLRSIGLGKASTHHFIEKLLPKEKIEERRKRMADKLRDDVRTVHEAYQFLARKYKIRVLRLTLPI